MALPSQAPRSHTEPGFTAPHSTKKAVHEQWIYRLGRRGVSSVCVDSGLSGAGLLKLSDPAMGFQFSRGVRKCNSNRRDAKRQ